MCFFVLGYDLVVSVKLEINLTTMRSFRAEKPLCGNQVTLSILVVLAVARFLFHYLPIFFASLILVITLHDVGKIRLVTV